MLVKNVVVDMNESGGSVVLTECEFTITLDREIIFKMETILYGNVIMRLSIDQARTIAIALNQLLREEMNSAWKARFEGSQI